MSDDKSIKIGEVDVRINVKNNLLKVLIKGNRYEVTEFSTSSIFVLGLTSYDKSDQVLELIIYPSLESKALPTFTSLNVISFTKLESGIVIEFENKEIGGYIYEYIIDGLYTDFSQSVKASLGIDTIGYSFKDKLNRMSQKLFLKLRQFSVIAIILSCLFFVLLKWVLPVITYRKVHGKFINEGYSYFVDEDTGRKLSLLLEEGETYSDGQVIGISLLTANEIAEPMVKLLWEKAKQIEDINAQIFANKNKIEWFNLNIQGIGSEIELLEKNRFITANEDGFFYEQEEQTLVFTKSSQNVVLIPIPIIKNQKTMFDFDKEVMGTFEYDGHEYKLMFIDRARKNTYVGLKKLSTSSHYFSCEIEDDDNTFLAELGDIFNITLKKNKIFGTRLYVTGVYVAPGWRQRVPLFSNVIINEGEEISRGQNIAEKDISEKVASLKYKIQELNLQIENVMEKNIELKAQMQKWEDLYEVSIKRITEANTPIVHSGNGIFRNKTITKDGTKVNFYFPQSQMKVLGMFPRGVILEKTNGFVLFNGIKYSGEISSFSTQDDTNRVIYGLDEGKIEPESGVAFFTSFDAFEYAEEKINIEGRGIDIYVDEEHSDNQFLLYLWKLREWFKIK